MSNLSAQIEIQFTDKSAATAPKSNPGRAAGGSATGPIEQASQWFKTASDGVGGFFKNLFNSVAGRAAGGAAGAGAAGTAGAAGAAGAGSAGAAGVGGAAGGALAAGMSIPLVGAIVGLTVAMGYAIKSTIRSTEENEKLAERLQPYSAALMEQNAKNDIRKKNADIRSADRMGELLAKNSDNQQRSSIAWEKIKDNVNSVIMPVTNTLGEIKAGIMEFFAGEEKENAKLPPGMDILGMFGDPPDLAVFYNGMLFAPDGRVLQQDQRGGQIPMMGL